VIVRVVSGHIRFGVVTFLHHHENKSFFCSNAKDPDPDTAEAGEASEAEVSAADSAQASAPGSAEKPIPTDHRPLE
jgi:hypothetical protein